MPVKLTLEDVSDTSDSISRTAEMPSPRFVKSHLPFHLLPKKLQDNSNTKVTVRYWSE